ncbi:MAG: GH32 C-terminal domain-containing protein, partial [Phycisphaerae bacterium]
DRAQFTQIAYHPAAGKLVINRNHAGSGDQGEYSAPVLRDADGGLDLRLFVDRSSVEVFAHSGRVAITCRVYPDASSLGVEAFSTGGDVKLLICKTYRLTCENV